MTVSIMHIRSQCLMVVSQVLSSTGRDHRVDVERRLAPVKSLPWGMRAGLRQVHPQRAHPA